MIVLDPDLDADRFPTVNLKTTAPPARRAQSPNNRVPSARVLARFLREAQSAVKLRGQVTVLLTTDRAIRRLNRQFRGKNKATDVLSFPAAKPSQISKARHGAPRAVEIAGDLAVSVETAGKQAENLAHALGVEIKVLMLHGLLHLAGYDHETDDGEMARLEERLRTKLRLPQGLIERSEAARSALSSPTHSARKLRNGRGIQRPGKDGKERRA